MSAPDDGQIGMPRAGVTAVVAHYGDPGRTGRVVRDLLAQQLGAPLQVVVVDDCSPEPFRASGSDVLVVRRSQNGGYGAAVNTGLAHARGDLVLVLNNDLRLGPGFVADLCARAAPYQPCVAGPATLEGGAFLVTGRRFPTVLGQSAEWVAPLASWRERPWMQRLCGRDLRCTPGAVVRDVDWLQGSVLLVPRRDLEAVGGFDERFFMFSEEVDLQRRLRRDRGLTGVFVGTVAVEHAGGASSDPDRLFEWLHRSRLTYAAVWGHERALRRALSAVTVINLVWNLALRLTGRPTAPIQAWRRQRRLVDLPTWPTGPGAAPG